MAHFMTARAAVIAYFEKRSERSFCVALCPMRHEASDTCPVADGEMPVHRCPDLQIALRLAKAAA